MECQQRTEEKEWWGRKRRDKVVRKHGAVNADYELQRSCSTLTITSAESFVS